MSGHRTRKRRPGAASPRPLPYGADPERTTLPDSPSGPGGAVAELLSGVTVRPEPEPLGVSPSLRGQCAIVTGGSSGIGRAAVITLADSGVNVAFNYLDTGPASRQAAEELADTLSRRKVKVFARAGDVRDSGAAAADFVATAHARLGGLHILVNNAGIGRDRALWRMSDEEWQAVIDTNLSGAFFFTRAAAPYLRAQEYGKIVNVSSVHGLSSEFGLANYCASKAGLIGLTRSTAVELGPTNVNVNAVAPGYIRTTQLAEHVPAEIIDRARERSALGRLGDPQDVASVILFLCSEAARHITGAVIPVDAGYLI